MVPPPVESPIVTSSYISYDAVLCWLIDKTLKKDGLSTSFVVVPDNFADKFFDALQNRGWSPLSREYIDTRFKTMGVFGGLTPQILKNVNMITDDQNKRIGSTCEYTPDELFGKDHDIEFKFKHDSITNCRRGKEGDCGFILRVSAALGEQDDSFNIKLLLDPNLYTNNIHFHEEYSFLVECSHLALDILGTRKLEGIPVTWYGKPYRDGTNKYWCWGAHRFRSNKVGRKPLKQIERGGNIPQTHTRSLRILD